METIYKKFDALAEKLSKLSLTFITALGMIMLAITIIAVFCRYVLSSSLQWGEEVLKIMLVWFGLFSVGVIAYQRQHVGVTIFKEHMNPKVQLICEKVGQVLILIVTIAMFIIGIMLVNKSGKQLTPALRIPYAVGYLAIPVAFGVMIIYEIRNTLYEFTVNLDGKDADMRRLQALEEEKKAMLAQQAEAAEKF